MDGNGNGAMAAAEAPLLLPHNLEAEESVLGAMMVSEAALDPVVVEVRLSPEDFYRGRHGTIYGAIHDLYERSDPVDALTVSELLRSQGKLEEVGGRDAISALASSTPVPGSAGSYAQIVKQNSMLRRLLGAAQRIQQSVHTREGEPQDLVEQAEMLLFNVARAEQAGDFSAISDILDAETDRLHKLASGETQMTGTPSGFRKLDDLTGGFQPGNLIVLAARPAMGKSSLVCNIAENVAWKAKLPVAFFSLEMSETELAHRFIASRARIASDRLRKGQVSKEWSKVLRACNELAEAPLWIDDSSDLSLLDLRAKCRRLHSSAGGLGLVIVDYIQLMRSDDPRAGRVEQVGQMSRGLKILARELNVPVIGISQLSRAPEQRPDKVPILSDLRESGCLTGDSRVFLPDTGGWATMEELAARGGGGGYPRVLALNEQTMKLEPKRVTNAFSTGAKPVFRLTTKLGRTVRATGNHRFRTIDGWRRLDELDVGEHLALPRSLPTGTRATMSGDELALLGHLIGDGCTLPRHAIQYTTNELGIAEMVAEFATSVFGDQVKPRVVRERNWWQLYLPSTRRLTHGIRNPVAGWLDGMGVFGLRSHEKRVPAEVFEQSSGLIARFLRHLWTTDGCLWASRATEAAPRIYYATSSVQLAADVQSLLLRLGINSRRWLASERKRGQWHVDVTGQTDMTRFLQVVGGLGASKLATGNAILNAFRSTAPKTYRDVVPRQAWHSLVKPAMAARGMTSRSMQAEIGTRYCGSSLYRSNMSRDRAARVAKVIGSEELATLADSGVYWDRIVRIEAEDVEEVYDLTVQDHHCFVCQDIIVHNSIEQDADIVSFIYRDEYYNKEETERPGEADLIIAKHRNGPIGTVPLAFQAQFPKFVNLASSEAGYGAGQEAA